MTQDLLNPKDVDFLLYEVLGCHDLLSRERFASHDRGSIQALLDLCETIATEQFAPHLKRSDTEEPRFVAGRAVLHDEIGPAVRAFADAGLIAATVAAEHGGYQLPQLVGSACMAWFQAANPSTTSYPFLAIAASNLLLEFGTEEQIRRWVQPMLTGRFLGSMALSEPQAGSALGDTTTRAIPEPGIGTNSESESESESESGTAYRLFGTKMWISGGDHDISENIVHLVLARIDGAPAGAKGLSLFIVPKSLVEGDGTLGARNDVSLVGLNHKMGYRGITNTVLAFGDGANPVDGTAGARGWLVGEEGRGLACMFHMMNEMRIGVGLGSVAMGYTGYQKSLRYARTRIQGRRTGAAPGSSPVTIVEHADVRRMLLAQKAYVEAGLAMNLYAARLLDDIASAPSPNERTKARQLLDVLTPVVKSWPAQWCLEANSLAIQVHGGYGYTREYDVEQHYRDNRLNAIHEGTHGIQGMDLLGRKVASDDGAGLQLLAERITDATAAARATGDQQLAVHAGLLEDTLVAVLTATKEVLSCPDAELRLANASLYLEVLGHLVAGWMWLLQEIAAHGRSGSFYAGKRQAALYFLTWELPNVEAKLAILRRLDATCLEMDDSWF